MTTPAQRIHDSHQRAQNLPRQPGPVDPHAAARMAAATQLAQTGLPDPALFATWAGHTQATTALDAAARAYAEGDHTRTAAWLHHTQIVLDANGIRADHPARALIDQIAATIAADSTVEAAAVTGRPVRSGHIDLPLIADGDDLASPAVAAPAALAGPNFDAAAHAAPGGVREPQVGTIGLFVLIERYELALIAQPRLDRTQQPELRASIDTYIADNHLHQTPLALELCLRDWASSHAPGLLGTWQRSIVAAGDYNAGADDLRTIDTARRWTPVLNNLTRPHRLPRAARPRRQPAPRRDRGLRPGPPAPSAGRPSTPPTETRRPGTAPPAAHRLPGRPARPTPTRRCTTGVARPLPRCGAQHRTVRHARSPTIGPPSARNSPRAASRTTASPGRPNPLGGSHPQPPARSYPHHRAPLGLCTTAHRPRNAVPHAGHQATSWPQETEGHGTMTTPDSSAPPASAPPAWIPPGLDVCASRLLALARTDHLDPGMGLHLLHAVDQLRDAGAQPVPIGLAPRPPEAIIRDVLAELAELPPAVFAHPSIAAAAAATRRALSLATSNTSAP